MSFLLPNYLSIFFAFKCADEWWDVSLSGLSSIITADLRCLSFCASLKSPAGNAYVLCCRCQSKKGLEWNKWSRALSSLQLSLDSQLKCMDIWWDVSLSGFFKINKYIADVFLSAPLQSDTQQMSCSLSSASVSNIFSTWAVCSVALSSFLKYSAPDPVCSKSYGISACAGGLPALK